MRVSRVLCAAATAVAMSGVARAQENVFRARAGAKSVAVFGNWSSTGGTNTYEIVLEGSLYVTASLAAVARFGLVKHSPEQREYFLGARYDFRGRSATAPYVIAGIESHDGARSSTQPIAHPPILDPAAGAKATFYEAGFGADVFMTRYSSLFIELAAFKTARQSGIGSDLLVGIRFFFR